VLFSSMCAMVISVPTGAYLVERRSA
jgi:hypothetical protein